MDNTLTAACISSQAKNVYFWTFFLKNIFSYLLVYLCMMSVGGLMAFMLTSHDCRWSPLPVIYFTRSPSHLLLLCMGQVKEAFPALFICIRCPVQEVVVASPSFFNVNDGKNELDYMSTGCAYYHRMWYVGSYRFYWCSTWFYSFLLAHIYTFIILYTKINICWNLLINGSMHLLLANIGYYLHIWPTSI